MQHQGCAELLSGLFTSKCAVNSGQISNRFMLPFFFFLLPHTTQSPPPSPRPLGATGVGSDGYEMSSHWTRGFSLSLNPSAWQKTMMLSAFSALYHLMPSPEHPSLFLSFLFFSVMCVPCPFSLSPLFFEIHSRAHGGRKALRYDAAWTFTWMAPYSCGHPVLFLMFCV